MGTLAAVYGWLVRLIGWPLALLVWGYALGWFLVNSLAKVAAHGRMEHRSGRPAQHLARVEQPIG